MNRDLGTLAAGVAIAPLAFAAFEQSNEEILISGSHTSV
jgi:hypothetical protein